MSQSRTRVVVGMPVYNSAQWLHSAVGAWLAQTMSEFRLIISDNASTDASFEICQEFARQDGRVSVYRNERNLGICANFRRLFELGCDSDYFMWAGSHDFFAPVTLQRYVATLDSRHDAVLCGARTRLFEGDVSNGTDEDPIPGLESDSPVERFRSAVSCIGLNHLVHGLIRTRALSRTRVMEDYFSSDNVLVAHLALLGKLIQLPERLFFRRMDPGAASLKMTAAELGRHWDPDAIGRTRFTHWKINQGLLVALSASGLPVAQKLHVLGFVLKCMLGERRQLASEVAAAFLPLRHGFSRE